MELLAGLEEAHASGLSHNNLVPANLMLSSDGVRLLGLGVSKRDPKFRTNSSKTRNPEPQTPNPELLKWGETREFHSASAGR